MTTRAVETTRMDAHTRALVRHMAARTGTRLTDRHESVLAFAYRFYARTKAGPLPHGIFKHTGVAQAELEQLFPNGLGSVYSWLGIPVHAGQKVCKSHVAVKVESPRQAYLDGAATAPLLPEVKATLAAFHDDDALAANPSSSHRAGKRAFEIVAEARARVAEALSVSPDEIVFTSGGSEANNLAIKGTAFAHLAMAGRPGRLVTTRTEHASTLGALSFLERFGFEVVRVDVGRDGLVSPEAIARAIAPGAVLVCAMAINNETGARNPVSALGEVCRAARVPLLVDAVQAFGKEPLSPREAGATMVSVSGHKIGAPKGIGALYVERGFALAPLVHGGEQEGGLRAGTENVGGALAFGLAAQLSCARREAERSRLESLEARLLKGLRAIAGVVLNGREGAKAPHIVNIGIEGLDSGSLLLSLSAIGISVSAGSACSAGTKESSHVLAAMGADTDRFGTMRLSFSHATELADIDYLLKYLPTVVEQLRRAGR